MNEVDNIVFVYVNNDSNVVKALNLEQAKEFEVENKNKEWEHVATLNSLAYIESVFHKPLVKETKSKQFVFNAETTQIYNEIEQGNICIAKFMEAHQNPQKRWYNTFEAKGGYRLTSGLKYHSDWSWLMSAVEKINERDYVTIFCDECRIHSLKVGEFKDIIVINESYSLIKLTFDAVVKYATWYLENIKEK